MRNSDIYRLLGTVLLLLGVTPPAVVTGQSETVALRGGRILTVTGGIVENGILVMQDGRITGIGSDVPLPTGARIVDVSGMTVMPGLIDGFTNLGAADYPSLGEDDDEATDPVTPHMRIIDGINPHNRFLPLARGSGVTSALVAPAPGNLLTGQSALIQLTGESVEEMVMSFPVGVHVSLGEAPKARYGTRNRAPMTRMGSAALLRQTLVDAKAYDDRLSRYASALEAFEAEEREEKPALVPRDLKLEALLPVVRGEKPLVVGADRYDDIHTSLRIAEEFDLKLVLNGGAEAHRVVEELAAAGVPVLWGPAGASNRELEAESGWLGTPSALAAAGIPFAFQTGSIADVTGLLNQARFAYAYGLSYQEALRALTLYPARIFGVEEEVGSLEPGKLANLLVLDGDPLDDNPKVMMVFIRGRLIEG